MVVLDKAPEAKYPLRSRTVKAMIPPLCSEGAKIRVPLYGRHHALRSEAGDLVLRVEYAPQEKFQVRGSHLYTSVAIFPWDAAMGATLPIESPEGLTAFEVPPGTHQRRSFCLQGKGLPKKDGARGNLYVYVKIQSVTAGNEKQRALWNALKGAYQNSERAS